MQRESSVPDQKLNANRIKRLYKNAFKRDIVFITSYHVYNVYDIYNFFFFINWSL